MTFEEIYDKVKDFEGWMGKEDCQVLYDYASKVENGLIVEIGSYGGISTVVMALSSPTSQVVAIDPYTGFNDLLEIFKERIKDLNILLIKDTSQNIGKIWTKEIDLLHIDGDHSYGTVKEDIELWVPHVRGYVLFHDFDVQDFGVHKAVDEMITEKGFAVLKK